MSRAGLMHCMMLSFALRALTGAMVPNLQPKVLSEPSTESVWTLTTVPPSSGPPAGSMPLTEIGVA